MRQHIRNLIEDLNKIRLFNDPILEFGSCLTYAGLESIANLRPIFKDKTYIGCDCIEGPGVDIVDNIQDSKLKSGSVKTILSVDMLEHVENPFKAFETFYRAIQEDGIVLVISVMDFILHMQPYDYWRFTPYSFKMLGEKFENKIIAYGENNLMPETIFGLYSKSKLEDISLILDKYNLRRL